MRQPLTSESVLDLPIEKQKEIAKMLGQSLEDWKESTKKRLDEAEEFCKMLDSSPPFDFSSSEREAIVRKRTRSEWSSPRMIKDNEEDS